ncbi:MAG TPA: LacI family DNA-binding transcriptional regulator [Nocardioides sp.]|nr:LacI family DNA-binding transcriptional regulator [Nocardioides sp.]
MADAVPLSTRRGQRPPGMHDVARLAGVSHQTVSRVINDLPNVRPATKKKVQDAIDSLGYRPNSLARALVTRRSGTLGVVTSNLDQWGPSSALLGIEHAAREAGYFVSVASVRTGDAVQEALAHFDEQLVEGVVVIAPEAALVHAADPLVAQIPVVMVGASNGAAQGVRVTSVNQDLGATRAVRHLIGLGHERIAHVAGPQEWFDANLRAAAWRRELDLLDLPARMIVGDWTPRGGYEAGMAVREMIRARDTDAPTAVFVANDLMALGLMRALHEGGLSVPGDVSVVGFDDIPGSDFFGPGLTTVRQDFQALGRQCIATLLGAMNGDPDQPSPIQPELVVRDSTGRPRSAAH